MKRTRLSRSRSGFTLIELLIVITIIAVVLAVALPNLLSARQRARDSKRKAELSEFKNALNLYFTDYQSYPTAIAPLNSNIAGCGATGTSNCPCSTSLDFASGATCTNVYMKKFPTDFNGGKNSVKYYSSNSNDFCLVNTLENGLDPDIATTQSKCASSCGANCNSGSRYCVCAD